MTAINIAEAKAKLSELLDRAMSGEEIVIARAGKPLVRLQPVADKPRRKRGAWRNWEIPDDVMLEPLSEEDLAWSEGKYSDEFGITRHRKDSE